jgi:hypothetical protein
MLTSLHIGNFKAFAGTQNIPIRPITLIFGPNSAGKSSIIHSLALAHEASRKGDLDIFRTEVGGSSIDLGGFRQYVHRREVIRRVEWGTTFETRHLKGRLAELLKPIQSISLHLTIGVELDDMGEPVRDAIPEVISYELESKGDTILRMSSRTNNTMAVDRLNFRHPVIRQIVEAVLQGYTTTQNVSEDDYESLNEAFFNIVEDLIATEIVFLPSGVIDKGKLSDDKDSSAPFFSVSKGNRTEDLGRALRFFLPRSVNELVTGLTNEVRKELQRMQYLGPLRSYPARHIAFSEHDDLNWYAGGGYAWDVVRKNFSVREKVNNWLSDPVRLQTPYELKVENLSHFDDLDATYEYEISQIEQRFSMNEELNEPPVLDLFGEIYGVFNILKKCADHDARIQELILYDKRTQTRVSHRDVGIGISQVLPVLVGAYASVNQMIAIEQPEIHLHPALQAELADVFIESALGEQKNTFILETHSEHLILRLLKRIRQTTDNELPEGATPVTAEDVAVLYVQPGKNGSEVIPIPVTQDGEFGRSWPEGFFAERAKELY